MLTALEALVPSGSACTSRSRSQASGRCDDCCPKCLSLPASTLRSTASIPSPAATYPLPSQWRERFGLRRFGFHGLSHAYAARRAVELAGHPLHRLVTCHLGAGSSLQCGGRRALRRHDDGLHTERGRSDGDALGERRRRHAHVAARLRPRPPGTGRRAAASIRVARARRNRGHARGRTLRPNVATSTLSSRGTFGCSA